MGSKHLEINVIDLTRVLIFAVAIPIISSCDNGYKGCNKIEATRDIVVKSNLAGDKIETLVTSSIEDSLNGTITTRQTGKQRNAGGYRRAKEEMVPKSN